MQELAWQVRCYQALLWCACGTCGSRACAASSCMHGPAVHIPTTDIICSTLALLCMGFLTFLCICSMCNIYRSAAAAAPPACCCASAGVVVVPMPVGICSLPQLCVLLGKQ
jgi:hypothetical protein